MVKIIYWLGLAIIWVGASFVGLGVYIVGEERWPGQAWIPVVGIIIFGLIVHLLWRHAFGRSEV